MSNQKRLEEYLVGTNGYLKNDISNGRVIMLSGKWGSGKTHFWKNIIEKDLIGSQTKKQKAYVYSSLYGNRTLDKIEDNIYAQAYLCSVGGKNVVLSGYEKVKDFGKRFGSFCSLLDVSKLVDGLDDIQQKNIKRSALSYLENGGVVCFDDFERKSKDIDLNDLFGFISHLAIDLNCKVVIILNDDVFEGDEKKIFTTVKEKSVSKFLKYEPSVKDLFKSIIFGKESNDKFKYSILRKHLSTILKTIKETEELNARIYIQVLDNLVEWIINTDIKDQRFIKYFIFLNINFILNHYIFKLKLIPHGQLADHYSVEIYIIEPNLLLKVINDFSKGEKIDSIEEFKIRILNANKVGGQVFDKTEVLDYIDNNESFVKSLLYFNKFKIKELTIHYDFKPNQDEYNSFYKINNFIETGIL